MTLQDVIDRDSYQQDIVYSTSSQPYLSMEITHYGSYGLYLNYVDTSGVEQQVLIKSVPMYYGHLISDWASDDWFKTLRYTISGFHLSAYHE